MIKNIKFMENEGEGKRETAVLSGEIGIIDNFEDMD